MARLGRRMRVSPQRSIMGAREHGSVGRGSGGALSRRIKYLEHFYAMHLSAQ